MTKVPVPKYAQAAAIVRAQVADGTLKPGDAAPSGVQLARLTGFCELTCRRALRILIGDGILVPGLSANARPPSPSPAGRPRRARPVSCPARCRHCAARMGWTSPPSPS